MESSEPKKRKIEHSDSSNSEDEPKQPKLEHDEQKIHLENPHAYQNKSCYYSAEAFTEKSRIIHAESKHEKYQRRSGQDKSTFHFGQRKLLLSEIEFLTLVVKDMSLEGNTKRVVLIYAGAAPSIHIPILINMFPFVDKFILIDPCKFSFDESKAKGKFEVINECFTNEMAKQLAEKYSDCELLLVSDIRTANHRVLARLDTELKIEQDMSLQMEWYNILQPYKSIFKFRLPYVGDDKLTKTELDYLDGVVYFQAWEGKTSSETRLIVNKNAKMKTYDCARYEDVLYRFNTVERVICYKHDVSAPGIDHCYDCRAEIFILEEYLKHKSRVNELYAAIYGSELKQTEVMKLESVADLIVHINKELNAERFCDELTITWNGKKNFYSIAFTEIEHGADLNRLFADEKIVQRRFFKYNSSEEEDENQIELVKKTCKSLHTLELKCVSYSGQDFEAARVLTDDFRQKIRAKEKHLFNDRTTVYFRERSLRLGEIEFLTLACGQLAKEQAKKKIGKSNFF